MWLLTKYCAKLLFERGHTLVENLGHLLDRHIVEDVATYAMLKIFGFKVDSAQQAVADTALIVAQNQIDQFGGFDLFGNIVDRKRVASYILVYINEEALYGAPSRANDKIFVVVGVFDNSVDLHLHTGRERCNNVGNLRLGVVARYLFELFVAVGRILNVVSANVEKEEAACLGFAVTVAREDAFTAPKYVAYCITSNGLGLYATRIRLHLFHNQRHMLSIVICYRCVLFHLYGFLLWFVLSKVQFSVFSGNKIAPYLLAICKHFANLEIIDRQSNKNAIIW